MATVVSFPFDVVRTRVVAQPTTNLQDPSSLYYTNTRNALVQIVRNEGFFGLYKGIWPQLLSMGPTSAIQFACYSTFTEIYYYMKQDQLNLIEKFLCGSLSGIYLFGHMYFDRELRLKVLNVMFCLEANRS